MERNDKQGLAFIRKVHNITAIPDADNIETAHVLGWTVVVKKGELSIGDKVVYFEIDSLLPLDNEHFAFLEPRGSKEYDGKKYHRLKTAKLRKQLSQGLIVKATTLNFGDMKEDEDVTEALGIRKYEIAEPGVSSKLGKRNAYGSFPTHLGFDKTDETRIQNAQFYIDQWKGKNVVGTVKMDGTSSTYFLTANNKWKETEFFTLYNKVRKFFGKEIPKFDFGVCSRNLRLKTGQIEKVPEFGNVYEKIAVQENIEKKLLDHYNETGHFLCVQGEICGHGVQGDPLKLAEKELKLFVFNVYNITEQKYLSCRDQITLLNKIQLPMVPICYQGNFEFNSVEELLAFSEGKYDSGVIREGVVFRLFDEPMKDNSGKNSFKVVSNSYLLKHDH